MRSACLELMLFVFGWSCSGLSACTVSSENEPGMEEAVMDKKMEEIAKQCYLEMYRAMMVKDSIGMDKILDKRFVLIHMTNMHQPKEEFINAVLNGTLNYYTADHDDIRLLAVDGKYASMVGKTRVNAAVFGGGRYTWRLRQDIKLVKRNGLWLISEARASTY